MRQTGGSRSLRLQTVLADRGSRNGSTAIRTVVNNPFTMGGKPLWLRFTANFAFVLNWQTLSGSNAVLEGVHVAWRTAFALQSCHFVLSQESRFVLCPGFHYSNVVAK